MIYDINGKAISYPNEWNGDYVIASDFSKNPVNVQEVVGSKIYGHQSFCKYNGYWFSARDNKKLWKQDANFNIITEKTIDLGHANGFQVGNSNIAYVWGWNDSKIYCLNLDTMEIDNTITLPVSGYTTGVVDEVRNLAYVFQRDSPTTTVENYNFITYDLTEGKIISSRKTVDKFGIMQDCDFWRDKIFLLDTLEEKARDGNTDGYKIYDTFGSLVAQYYIPTIAALDVHEIEGVWIDRDNDDIYISVGHWDWEYAKLFKVTSY